MAEAPTPTVQKERSPSYPFIPLGAVLQRLAAFEQTFGRHPAPATKAGLAWGMKEKSSQASQVLAAMKAFDLVRYQGGGENRLVHLTDAARTYLRAQQDSVKQQVIKEIALKPKLLHQFWKMWGQKRPIDDVCLDTLVLTYRFTGSAAHNFLKVYDATIAFAGLSDSDTGIEPSDEDGAEETPPAPQIKVGDLVQIEVNGAFVLPQPKRVRAIQQHEGQDWIFIEGSETGFEMNQAILHEPAAQTPKVPPRLALETRHPSDRGNVAPEGWSEETLIDDDGSEIKIRYFGKASLERYKFIRDYLDFKILRLEPKAKKGSGDGVASTQ